MGIEAALIMGGASLLGGKMQSDAAGDAARQSAQAQLESARIAAEAAKFRPVGVTTRYGKSNFQFNKKGYLSGAGYEISPELRAYQDRLQGLTRGALTQAEMAQEQYAPLQQGAQGLFGLGQQYLAQSPEEVAAQYMSRQQDGAGGLGATTPEMEAYYNAIAQQDAALAAQAQQAGQQNVAFGTGLLGSGANLMGQYQAGQVGALSPFTSYLGAGSTLEQLGQQSLEMGSALGGRSATAGGNVGQFLLSGGQGAARAIQGAAGSGVGSALIGLGNNPYVGYGLNQYLNPPQQQTLSDAYQASIPVNNQSSGYFNPQMSVGARAFEN